MSHKTRTNTRRLTTTAALALPLITAAITATGTASAHQTPHPRPPDITAAAAAAITEARLPQCTVTDLQLYHDDDHPMWFIQTECTDDTWKDVRLDATTGRIIAINGDYDI